MEPDGGNLPPNPLEPAAQLKDPTQSSSSDKSVHPQQAQNAEDSAVTKAEKYERHGAEVAVEEPPAKGIKLENATKHEEREFHDAEGDVEESSSRRMKLQNSTKTEEKCPSRNERPKGVAPIKREYVVARRVQGSPGL